MELTSLIQDLIDAGRLESAWDMIKKNDISLDDLDYQEAFKGLESNLHLATAQGDIRVANRLKRAFPDKKIYIRHS